MAVKPLETVKIIIINIVNLTHAKSKCMHQKHASVQVLSPVASGHPGTDRFAVSGLKSRAMMQQIPFANDGQKGSDNEC